MTDGSAASDPAAPGARSWIPAGRAQECPIGLVAVGAAVLLALACAPVTAGAQAPADVAAVRIPPEVRIDDPPPPTPPAVINRDEGGGATVRAVPLSGSLRLDGRLDEPVYEEVPPITGLIQVLPDEGAPATEKTEVWITYDDTDIYVSARLHDSAPESEWVANEMRRDTNQLRQNDSFGVVFDTFYDRRNGVMFYTNPLGARADFAMTNEGSPNGDWNPIWDVRVGRFEGGWTVEMEIPFKSLRYRPGRDQVWGIQLRRAIRRKNEWVHLTGVPRSTILGGNGATAVFRISANGTLVGLQVPEASRNLDVKPYAISGAETDRAAEPPVSRDAYADAGLDVKYGVTQNLTLDLTYNTDFAQVEVDEQQVNLTRFNLFFPEKREFFLEGRGIFDFATSGFNPGGVGNVPRIFFSRRIGLEGGEPVPILAGARLTGKVGAFDVGAVNIQTEAEAAVGVESTNFTVLRLRRNLFGRSSLGALFTNRSQSTVAEGGSNQAYGVDATFSSGNMDAVAYYARTRTLGLESRDESWQGRFAYDGDAWGGRVEHLMVGESFNPEVGFLRRRGFRESFASGRFSPRPASIEAVRQLTFQGSIDYIEDAGEGFVETRTGQLQLQAEFESSDLFRLSFNDNYEFLERVFPIAPRVEIPVGGYRFQDVEVGYDFGLHRWWSGNLSLRRGSFYGGDKTTVAFRRGRVNLTEQLSLEPTLSFNWVDLPQGSFRTDLAVTRVNYAFTPRMFLSGLVQYNSSGDTFSTNFRLRWEYLPGSELFVVYTEARDTGVFDRFSRMSNRALAIKINYLLRF